MERRVVFASLDVRPRDPELAAELSALADLFYRKDLVDNELARVMAQAEVLIAGGWRGSITDIMVSQMPNLEFIQTLAAGVNHVPFSALPASVTVSTGSGANSREVAEHAFAMILAAAKNVVKHTAALRRGSYPHGELSRMLRGKVLGVLGVGSIGSNLVEMGRCFGMRILGCDVKSSGQNLVDRFFGVAQLPDFLGEIDFLVICVPLTRKTSGMLGRSELSVMKRDAVLVNVSRGAVIKEEDIYEHLARNPLFTACFDVWWRYSPDKTFRQNYPFEDLENVLMTPHNATHSPGQRERMVKFAFDKVVRYLKGEILEGLADPADYI
jgi:phosphoglycerate dehydrogenase-like enzyme